MLKLHRLLLHGVDLVSASAVGLLGHPGVEVEVVNVGLLGEKLDGLLIHLLLASILLALKDSLSLLGHLDLGELEENLEVGDEGRGVVRRVSDSFEDFTLLSLGVHVDILSDLLDISLLEGRGIGVLDVRGEDVGGLHNRFSLNHVGGVLLSSNESGDKVEDLSVDAGAWVPHFFHDLLDICEGVLVASLDELGLVLLHAGDELVDIGELLVAGLEFTLLGQDSRLGLLEGILGLSLLVSDLNDEKERLVNWIEKGTYKILDGSFSQLNQ